jgi:flagellar motor switch protein FliN/FliY
MAKATQKPVPSVQIPDATAAPTAVAVAEAPASGQIPVQAAQFPDAVEGQVAASGGQFDLLLDMDVPITVMLGQAQVPVRRLLQLGPGAVVSLDKPIEAPVELYLQGAKFAEGDVVVVDNRFGIRIRQVMAVEGGDIKGKA